MKRMAAALALASLCASPAVALDFEDFVGRYSGTAQVVVDLPAGQQESRMQGRVVLRVRDERIEISGEVSSKGNDRRLRFDFDLEDDEMRVGPAFPFNAGDDSFLTMADLQISRIKGGYRLGSSDFRWRDRRRARGFFTLERTGEEVALEYFLKLDDDRRLRLTVNADR